MTTTGAVNHGFALHGATTPQGITLMVRPAQEPEGSVVLVHGTLDRGGSFSRVARRLEGLNAVTFDRRGYQSSRSLGGAARLGEHLEDLSEVFAAVRDDGPITLVGHSFGGVIAIAAAMASPGAVDSVIAYEPPMPWLWEDSHPHRGMAVDGEPAVEVERFFRRMVSDQAWEHLGEAERESRIADAAGLMSDLHIIRVETPFTMEAVGALEVPLTIAIGATAEGHRRTAERVVAAAPHATLVNVDGAPHGAHLSHPDTLAEIIMAQAARRQDAS